MIYQLSIVYLSTNRFFLHTNLALALTNFRASKKESRHWPVVCVVVSTGRCIIFFLLIFSPLLPYTRSFNVSKFFCI